MMSKKKIAITTGGTGGHVYPALALAQQISKACTNAQIVFIGSGLQSNRYFNRSISPFYEVASDTLSFKNPWKLIKGVFSILKGMWQSYRILKHFSPDVLVGFGSYHTFPTLLAAKLLSIPIVLHEANSVPGKVQKLMSPYVKLTALHFPGAASFLKGKSVEVGLPLREGYNRSCVTKIEALRYFQLDDALPTVLVFGGSQGARAINRLFLEGIQTRSLSHIQVIHLTGDASLVDEARIIYAKQGIRVCVKAYETQMNFAWAAADLFVARAGAATIAEAMEFEVPGILIPYPTATDNHQEKNADFLVDIVGGAHKLLEYNLTGDRLCGEVYSLFGKNQGKLICMQNAMHQYKTKFRCEDLGSLVLRIATEKKLT